MSCTASENLDLIQRIFELKSKLEPVEKFPKLFKGIGKAEMPYQIKLKNDAKLYAISVPLQVLLALKNKLKELLDEITENGIIGVIIPKKKKKIM